MNTLIKSLGHSLLAVLILCSGFKNLNAQSQWKEIHAPELNMFNMFDIHRTGDTLMAVGYMVDGQNSVFESVILRSHDNAKSWTPYYVNSRFIKSIDVNSEGVAFAGGFGISNTSYIMKSENFGESWTDHFVDGMNSGITELQFVNDSVGYASGYGSMQFATPMLYRTTDGGTTWEERLETSPQYTTFDKVTFIGNETYALSSVYFNGSLLGAELNYSADQGKNWIKIHENDEALGGMAWVTETKGYLITEGGKILRSTDGGVNWSQVHSTGGKALFGIAMTDSVGFAVGAEGIILRTKNGGDSWTRMSSSTQRNLISVVINGDRTFVTGEDGLILQLGGSTGSDPGNDDEPGDDGNPGEWPVGLDEVSEIGWNVFPNPTSGIFSVQVEACGGCSVILFDIQGRKLDEKPMMGSRLDFNLSNQPNGMYIIEMRGEESVTRTKILKH